MQSIIYVRQGNWDLCESLSSFYLIGVIHVTSWCVSNVPHSFTMAKKAISALLLVAITAWAEMALAPMLAMHAGHMRMGHETVADMPAAQPGHNHAAHHHSAQSPAQNSEARNAEEATGGKPCCPHLQKSEPPVLLFVVEEGPGCESHSCCFRQGPQSVPAQARDAETASRELVAALSSEVEIDPSLDATRNVFRDRPVTLHPPPDLFSMTLRV